LIWKFQGGSSSGINLQPLLQLGALEKVQFIFSGQAAQLQDGLLHSPFSGVSCPHSDWCIESAPGERQVVWRTAASTAEQGAVGDVQPAAAAAAAVAGASWGARQLNSVRLKYDTWFESMPMAAVQSLGALQLTELAIHGGEWIRAHLGIEVTPAQLGEVLQRLPLLQRLELWWFALLCDAEFAGGYADGRSQRELPAQQQQQQEEQLRMQPCHSTAGVTALVSAIGQLRKLQVLQLELPLLLMPRQQDLEEVQSALERWVPGVHLQNCLERIPACGPVFALRRNQCR
jgi:hypothetical protein